jgi:hypothetical protein
MLATGAGHVLAPELSPHPWYPIAMTLAPVVGVGTLVLGLWLQACYVAYVCADPPEAAQVTWFQRISGVLRRLWPFGARAAADVETKPVRRRKKGDEEDAESAPKRRRKPAAKSKRTTRTRTRAKPDIEETDDESAAEESWDESNWDESTETPATSEEAEWEDEHASPSPSKAKAVAVAPASSRGAPAAAEDDAEDDEHRLDGPHENSEMFKGLSKRQRRELKKQLRDQQRSR